MIGARRDGPTAVSVQQDDGPWSGGSGGPVDELATVFARMSGLLLSEENVAEDTAITLLTARAQRSSRSLRETARGVVRSTVRLRR
jgi:hypothetical protein